MANGKIGGAVTGESGGYESVFFSASDGLRLHAADYGRNNLATRGRLPVVCLPGLTRNTRDFDDLARLLSTDTKVPRRVVSFDYRGRGQSGWDKDPARYNITVEAEDVLSGMAALGLEHASFIGTSRGGLIMHVLAAMRPGVMAAGVLNDIGPVIEGAGLAQIKAYLSRTPKPQNWADAAQILSEAHSKSFPALTEADWADFAREIFSQSNRDITVTGIATSDYPTPAKRPLNSRLDCASILTDFGIIRPSWIKSLFETVEELSICNAKASSSPAAQARASIRSP